jgi:hypothetical protein
VAWSIFSQPSGDELAKGWATDLLKAIQAPVTPGNLQFIYDWEVSEGGGGEYNPLNQGPVPGDPSLSTTGEQYGGGAANFATWAAGVQGAADYIEGTGGVGDAYHGILTALRANDPTAARAALIASPWAASHYGYGAAFSDEPLPGGEAVLPPYSPTSGAAASSSGIGGVVKDIVSGLALPVSWAEDLLNGPSDVAQAIVGLASPFVKVAESVDWLFHPNHWIRVFAGAAGGFLLLSSVQRLSRISEDQPAALPVGILTGGVGAVLLFVAFHNLPSSVGTFPEFVGYLSDEISGGTKDAVTAK